MWVYQTRGRKKCCCWVLHTGVVYRLVLRLVTCYFRLFSYLGIAGYLGPETQAMSVMQKHVVTEHLDQDVAEQAITVETVRLELSLKNST